MPKIKQTARKEPERPEPERPEPAVTELCCSHCGHTFTKGYNFRRHLSIIHGVDEHGQPTSAADCTHYLEYDRKVSE